MTVADTVSTSPISPSLKWPAAIPICPVISLYLKRASAHAGVKSQLLQIQHPRATLKWSEIGAGEWTAQISFLVMGQS